MCFPAAGPRKPILVKKLSNDLNAVLHHTLRLGSLYQLGISAKARTNTKHAEEICIFIYPPQSRKSSPLTRCFLFFTQTQPGTEDHRFLELGSLNMPSNAPVNKTFVPAPKSKDKNRYRFDEAPHTRKLLCIVLHKRPHIGQGQFEISRSLQFGRRLLYLCAWQVLCMQACMYVPSALPTSPEARVVPVVG